MPTITSNKTLLLIGASRGLGYALAEEYLQRGWDVVATERAGHPSRLHDLAGAYPGPLTIETVDIVQPDQVTALRRCRSGRADPSDNPVRPLMETT